MYQTVVGIGELEGHLDAPVQTETLRRQESNSAQKLAAGVESITIDGSGAMVRVVVTDTSAPGNIVTWAAVAAEAFGASIEVLQAEWDCYLLATGDARCIRFAAKAGSANCNAIHRPIGTSPSQPP